MEEWWENKYNEDKAFLRRFKTWGGGNRDIKIYYIMN